MTDQSVSPTGPAPARSWGRWLRAAGTDLASLVIAVATGGSLFRVTEVLRRNPFGLKELLELLGVLLCALATFGFYRFLMGIIRRDGLMSQHPGHVAWWLVGGVWVTAAAVDLVVESASYESAAVFDMTRLGMLLALPLLALLFVAALRRRERSRSDLRAWLGLVVGCTFPVQCVLFFAFRD